MKYLIALGCSVVLLLGFILREEILLKMRDFLHDEDPKEKRRKDYKVMLIIWSLFTVAIFILFIFFVE